MSGYLRSAVRIAFAACLLAQCGLAGAAEVDLKADERLAPKVSVALGNATLDDVVKAVGQQVKVPLGAGQNVDDWLSREMPVSVFVKEMPAYEVMDQLAKLTGFHWSEVGTESEGNRGYRLWQDLKGRTEQAELRDTQLRAEQAERTRRGLRNIESIARLSRLTPGDLEALADKDPTAFMFATEPGFKAIPQLLSGLTLEQQLRATTSEGIRVPYGQMAPPMQAAVKDFVLGMRELVKQIAPQASALFTTEPEWDKAILVVSAPSYSQAGSMAAMAPVTGELKVEGLDMISSNMQLPIVDTASEVGRLVGKALGQLSQGVPVVNLQVTLQQEFAKMLAKGAGDPPPAPTDPDLLKPVKFEVEGWTSLAQQIEALHKASGLNIIADSLPQPQMQGPTLGTAIGQEAPLYQVLFRLRSVFGLEYEKVGSLLRLRDVEWAKKRDWLVPRALTARWKERVQSESGPTLQDLVEMAALTDDQAKYGLLAEPELLFYSVLMQDRIRPALRLLGALTPEQRKQLEAGEKLALESLKPEQAAQLQAAWEAAHRGRDAEERALEPGMTVSVQKGGTGSEGGGQQAQEPPLLDRTQLMLVVEKPGAESNPMPASPLGGMDTPKRSLFLLVVMKQPDLPGLPAPKKSSSGGQGTRPGAPSTSTPKAGGQ